MRLILLSLIIPTKCHHIILFTSAIFLQPLRSYHVQNTAPPQFWLGAEQAVSRYILARFVLPYRVFGNLRAGPPLAHMGGKDSVPGGQLQEYCMEHWIDSDISVPSQAKHVIHKLTQMDIHVHTRTHTYVYMYCYIYPPHVLMCSRRSARNDDNFTFPDTVSAWPACVTLPRGSVCCNSVGTWFG